MLKFVGDIGLYLPDRDVIRFTALNGRTIIGCYVGTSALDALGGSKADSPMELVDRFHRYRDLFQRVARFKWGNGQTARSDTETTVTIEEIDLYNYSRAWGAEASENLMESLGMKPRLPKVRPGMQKQIPALSIPATPPHPYRGR
jgi:hypothetical protein